MKMKKPINSRVRVRGVYAGATVIQSADKSRYMVVASGSKAGDTGLSAWKPSESEAWSHAHALIRAGITRVHP